MMWRYQKKCVIGKNIEKKQRIRREMDTNLMEKKNKQTNNRIVIVYGRAIACCH